VAKMSICKKHHRSSISLQGQPTKQITVVKHKNIYSHLTTTYLHYINIDT